MSAEQLITQHIDLWTSTIKARKTQGRGSNKKRELYGIKKLRELILELAMNGKLVPQVQDALPSCHFKLVDEEIIKLKVNRKGSAKVIPNLDMIKQPQVPSNWAVIRVNEIILTTQGVQLAKDKQTSKLKDGFKRYLYISDFKHANNLKYVVDGYPGKEVTESDLVMANTGSPGEVYYGVNGILSNNLFKISFNNDLFSQEFVYLYFKSPGFISGLSSQLKGAAQQHLGHKLIGSQFIVVPPLDEQHRIVAKVDELMALCDQLEQQTESSLDAHNLLVDTLLTTLTDAHDAKELNDNWARLADHFDALITTDYAVEQLKQTILQLAVMGKLVPQNPNDEPTSELLKRIAAEKAQLIKDKKIKKQKPLLEISDEEKPFELPTGWEWVRFSFLSNEVATGPFGSMIHKTDYVVGGVPLINPSHMIESKIVEDISISVATSKAKELSSYTLYENDIVMARRGEMGRCALVTKREEGWLCGTGSFVLRFNSILPRQYILLLFSTQWVKAYLGGKSVGTTMTNLNHSILNKLPLLIPPVAEQHRIVTKVDELMTLCNQLKAQLNDAQTTQLHLSDAVVENALTA